MLSRGISSSGGPLWLGGAAKEPQEWKSGRVMTEFAKAVRTKSAEERQTENGGSETGSAASMTPSIAHVRRKYVAPRQEGYLLVRPLIIEQLDSPIIAPCDVAAFLVSDGAAALTGNIEYVDAGYHIVG